MITKIFNKWYGGVFFIFVIIIIPVVFFILFQRFIPLLQESLPQEFQKESGPDANSITDTEPQESIFKPPKIIKAVYLTNWSAARPEMVDYVIDIAKNTEINAVVIDIKDWSGYIAYDTQIAEAEEYNTERILISDIEKFLKKFHEEKIYTIARITVFQDPALARAKPNLAIRQKSDKSLLWLDGSGLAWIDPASKEAWDYNVAIAKDAWNRGFDELNFDYVRFPSDGNLQDMSFPIWDGTASKDLVIKEFYKHLRENLPRANLSVDLFGLSTVNSGLGVGHIIENAYRYFDFVSPMVYPSHYAEGFLGYQNPAEYPYEVVKYSMERALEKLNLLNQLHPTKAKLRPWIQDFDLRADYTEKQVRLEIDAVSEALGENFSGFMLWNSKNIYTKDAFLPAKNDK